MSEYLINLGMKLQGNKLVDNNGNVIRDNLSEEVIDSFEQRYDDLVIGRIGFILDRQGNTDFIWLGYDEGIVKLSSSYDRDSTKLRYDILQQVVSSESFWSKVKCDLSNADLLGADMRDAKLSQANLSNADLLGADMENADLREANLSGADLRFANLRLADLRRANLTGADLTGANLDGVDLEEANLTNAVIVIYDDRGFNKDGVHQNGTRYDDQGFDVNKVHQNGTKYNEQGFDCDGFNAEGFDAEGYDRARYDRAGWDSSGYGRDGFNRQGYDHEGYGRDGFNQWGLNRQGCDRSGQRFRVIRERVPRYSSHSPGLDDRIAFSVRQELSKYYGIPSEYFKWYYFSNQTCFNVVYAADTPNVDKITHHDQNYQIVY